jgi:CheY-like chemotaxis protein
VGEPSVGLGIGLHLAKVFAQLHGGSVAARSGGAGQGSEFVLSLPVVLEVEPLVPQTPALPSPGVLPGKVLVVDDNVDAACTLASLLELQGVDVSVAYDGAAAVAAVHREVPDAVIMDIGMPVMNGYEAARSISRDFAERKPLLIALTGWGQFADKALAREAGFDHHFVKPLDFQKLVCCLAGQQAEG